MKLFDSHGERSGKVAPEQFTSDFHRVKRPQMSSGHDQNAERAVSLWCRTSRNARRQSAWSFAPRNG